MAQLVARLSGGQEAVSSSLATPTKQSVIFMDCFFIRAFPWRNRCGDYARNFYP